MRHKTVMADTASSQLLAQERQEEKWGIYLTTPVKLTLVSLVVINKSLGQNGIPPENKGNGNLLIAGWEELAKQIKFIIWHPGLHSLGKKLVLCFVRQCPVVSD